MYERTGEIVSVAVRPVRQADCGFCESLVSIRRDGRFLKNRRSGDVGPVRRGRELGRFDLWRDVCGFAYSSIRTSDPRWRSGLVLDVDLSSAHATSG